MVVEGLLLSQSYLWAAPLICVLIVLVAVDLPLMLIIGGALVLRIATDDLSSEVSRQSTAIDVSVLIAVIFILIGAGVAIHYRKGARNLTLMLLWLAIWTVVAIGTLGPTTLALREPLRELSIVALGMIVCLVPGFGRPSIVVRLVQLAGVLPGVLAIEQLLTHTGMRIEGVVRAYGTFAHPNSAALFFAIAATASLWRYLDYRRQTIDAVAAAFFSLAALSTFSLGGIASLLIMFLVFGVSRGSVGAKYAAWAGAIIIVGVFVATPLGSERISHVSAAQLGTSYNTENSSNSLEWRFYNWEQLLPRWEESPFVGQGLGETVADTSASAVKTLPHNEYLRYLVETGIIGIVALGAGVVALIQGLRRRRHLAVPGAAAMGLALVSGMLVNAIAANTILYTAGAYAAAAVLASVLADGESPSVRQISE
jgi:O-antigen ligase